MYRLLLTSLICLGLLAPASASAWWQDDWQYRKQVSVDTTPQGAAIYSLPVTGLWSHSFSFGVDFKDFEEPSRNRPGSAATTTGCRSSTPR